jgi:hypothetical protein
MYMAKASSLKCTGAGAHEERGTEVTVHSTMFSFFLFFLGRALAGDCGRVQLQVPIVNYNHYHVNYSHLKLNEDPDEG